MLNHYHTKPSETVHPANTILSHIQIPIFMARFTRACTNQPWGELGIAHVSHGLPGSPCEHLAGMVSPELEQPPSNGVMTMV